MILELPAKGQPMPTKRRVLALVVLFALSCLFVGHVAATAVPTGALSGFTQVAAGGGFTCGLTAAGGVKCWGAHMVGAVGARTTPERHVAVDVYGLGHGFSQLAAGADPVCALVSGAV